MWALNTLLEAYNYPSLKGNVHNKEVGVKRGYKLILPLEEYPYLLSNDASAATTIVTDEQKCWLSKYRLRCRHFGHVFLCGQGFCLLYEFLSTRACVWRRVNAWRFTWGCRSEWSSGCNFENLIFHVSQWLLQYLPPFPEYSSYLLILVFRI